MPTTVPHSHTLAVEACRNPFSGTRKIRPSVYIPN
jgi:hypothetical protein